MHAALPLLCIALAADRLEARGAHGAAIMKYALGPQQQDPRAAIADDMHLLAQACRQRQQLHRLHHTPGLSGCWLYNVCVVGRNHKHLDLCKNDPLRLGWAGSGSTPFLKSHASTAKVQTLFDPRMCDPKEQPRSPTSTACDSSCPDPALDPLLALPLPEAGASVAAAAAEPPAAASAGLEADLAAAASVPTRALAAAADGFKGIQKPCCVVKPVPVPCDLRTQPCMVQRHHPLLLQPGHASVGAVSVQRLRGSAHVAAHRAGRAPAAA